MNLHDGSHQQSKKRLEKKMPTSMEVIKNYDMQSIFKMEDIKKINKFDGIDETKMLSRKNSSTDFILASVLEFLCTNVQINSSTQGTDKKTSEIKFQDITCFLIKKGLLNSSSTRDEFQALRATISKILFNLPVFKSFHLPLTTYPQNLNIYERYKFEFDDTGQLGKGGFGSVRKAINKLDGQCYAIKIIRLKAKETPFEIKRILDEVKTLARLKHKNIVGYNSAWLESDIFMTGTSSNKSWECSSSSDVTSIKKLSIKEIDSSSNSSDSSDSSNNQLCNANDPSLNHQFCKTLYIQMEHCQQTLEDWLNSRNNVEKPLIGCIDVTDNRNILKGIVEGLQFIHSNSIIHRDIKPANIFLQDNFSVKIGDFGLAKNRYSSDSDASEEDLLSLSIGVGTQTYSAPEQQNSSNYNTMSDIYSLGLIIYELYYPFTTICERSSLFSKLKETSAVDDFVKQNFPDMAELIEKTIRKDPVERLTAQDILDLYLWRTKDDIIRDQYKEIESLKKKIYELTSLQNQDRMFTKK